MWTIDTPWFDVALFLSLFITGSVFFGHFEQHKPAWRRFLKPVILVAMLLTLVGDLSTLAETVVLLLLFVFISTNLAVLVLRRDTVEHRHFRVWTPVPVLGVASCVLLLTQQSAKVWLFAGVLLVVGAVLYVLARAATRRGSRAASPVDESV